MVHVGDDDSDRQPDLVSEQTKDERVENPQVMDAGGSKKAVQSAANYTAAAPEACHQPESPHVSSKDAKIGRDKHDSDGRFRTDLNIREWISAIATVVAAGAAIAAVGVAYCSYQGSNNQLGVMKKQLIDAETAASAAAVDELSAATREGKLISANEKLAQAAGEQARASKNLAITSSRELDQQNAEFLAAQAPTLQIGPDGIPAPGIFGPVYDPDIRRIGWNYGIKNVGKGAATAIHGQVYLFVVGQPPWRSQGSFSVARDVVEGEGVWGTAWGQIDISPAEAAKVMSNESAFTMAIDLFYSDAAHKIYERKICAVRHANGSMGVCSFDDILRSNGFSVGSDKR